MAGVWPRKGKSGALGQADRVGRGGEVSQGSSGAEAGLGPTAGGVVPAVRGSLSRRGIPRGEGRAVAAKEPARGPVGLCPGRWRGGSGRGALHSNFSFPVHLYSKRGFWIVLRYS